MSAVFEYTGNGQSVPKNVVSVRFHPSVGSIDVEAFEYCTHLREVVLNVGLKKIGFNAFRGCSLDSITYHLLLSILELRHFFFVIT